MAPFGETLESRWRDVEREIDGLAAAIGIRLRAVCVPAPAALAEAPRNAFLSPIKNTAS